VKPETKKNALSTNASDTRDWLITPLGIFGVVLVVSGFVHLGIWCASGTSWSGEVSWRKPTLFGVSGGITLISIAALMPRLRPRRRDPYVACILSMAMLLEVSLISLQQWRGVASHFNDSTPLDAAVDLAITILICIVTVGLLDFGLRSFGPMAGTSDGKLAWRGGIAFLLISCGVGFAMLAYGHYRTSAGQDPTIYGAAGVVKFPHGMTIHAIQSFPIMAWFLVKLHVPEADRLRVIGSLIVSMSLLLAYSTVQTLAGRDRGDVTPLSLGLLVLAILFAAPLARTVLRLALASSKQALARS
jgi:hypothetical protein